MPIKKGVMIKMFKLLPKIKTFKLPPTTSTTIFGQTVPFSDALKFTFFGRINIPGSSFIYLNVSKKRRVKVDSMEPRYIVLIIDVYISFLILNALGLKLM